MRMHVSLATLGTLLDFPAGVSVVGVDVASGPVSEGTVTLYLEGVYVVVDGEEVTAEYSVDAKGRRTFGRFKAPEPEPELTPPPEDPPAPVVEDVGAPPAPPAKATGATKKAGS